MKNETILEFLRSELQRMIETGDPEELTKLNEINVDEALLWGYKMAIADVEVYERRNKK